MKVDGHDPTLTLHREALHRPVDFGEISEYPPLLLQIWNVVACTSNGMNISNSAPLLVMVNAVSTYVSVGKLMSVIELSLETVTKPFTTARDVASMYVSAELLMI